MQTNLNNYQNQCCPNTNPNAVSINIFTPQAYACSNNQPPSNNLNNPNYYSLYGNNTLPNMPVYPSNYNAPIYNYSSNPIQQSYQQNPNQMPLAPVPTNPNNELNPNSQANLADNSRNTNSELNNINNSSKTEKSENTEETDKKKKKDKVIIPLSDDYIKNLENYMNSPNSKIRLIGIKEVMERFKEDENRKDNKSLIPLLNKALQDSNSAVRFLALTTLQLGYSVGDETTVQLLTKIANENQDRFGQDAILASEILLRLSAPTGVKVKEGGK